MAGYITDSQNNLQINRFLFCNLLATIFFICCIPAFVQPAYSSPESRIREAVQKIETASRLVEKAKGRLTPGATLADLEVAMDLYLEAGQLFEKAGKIMKVLGPQYVSENDLEGCGQALQSCIQAIEELKQRIRTMKGM